MALNPQPLPQNNGQSTVQSSQLQAGKDVTLNANRDVNLLSAKNPQYLDGKNASASGSFTFGSMTGSGSISLSKDKMHSNYDSVHLIIRQYIRRTSS
jgi:hypothetical protein